MTQPFDQETPTVSGTWTAERERLDAAGRLLTEIAREIDADSPPLTCADLVRFVDACPADTIANGYARLREVAKQGDTWLAWIVPSARTDKPSMHLNPSVYVQREILNWALE